MAVNRAPSAWIPSFAYSSNTLSIPRASLPGLSDAHANASTGDAPSIVLAALELINRHYAALATADRPTGFEISKSPLSIPTGTDPKAGKEGYEYRVRIYFDSPDVNGAMAEPT